MRPVTFLSMLYGASSATALGINCRGSALCSIGPLGGDLGGVIKIVGDIPSSDSFGPGQHLACQGHLCAFTQDYGQNITAGDALGLLNGLSSHGCKGCGSNPILPGNDVSTGQLTANYVEDAEIPGSGKCGPQQERPTCPGASCHNFNQFCYYTCCQGPTPITNPLSCSSVNEQCFCANQCGCCI